MCISFYMMVFICLFPFTSPGAKRQSTSLLFSAWLSNSVSCCCWLWDGGMVRLSPENEIPWNDYYKGMAVNLNSPNFSVTIECCSCSRSWTISMKFSVLTASVFAFLGNYLFCLWNKSQRPQAHKLFSTHFVISFTHIRTTGASDITTASPGGQDTLTACIL